MANVYKLMNIMETSYAHVYAIGDLVPGYQLAHTASAHGKYVAEYIAGKQLETINQEDIPRCIYTRLESASVEFIKLQEKHKRVMRLK